LIGVGDMWFYHGQELLNLETATRTSHVVKCVW
jgi:hypothetical protein